jgi:hypothetical protein
MALRRGHLECGANRWPDAVTSSQHAYEVRPRKDKRGVDLISEALPVPPSRKQNDGQMGRRIFLRWDLTTGPNDREML